MLIEVLVKGLEEWAEFRGVEGPEIAAAERQLQLGGLDGKGRKCCHWESGVGAGGAGVWRTTPLNWSCSLGGTGHLLRAEQGGCVCGGGKQPNVSLLSPFIFWHCLPWTKSTQKPEGKKARERQKMKEGLISNVEKAQSPP